MSIRLLGKDFGVSFFFRPSLHVQFSF